VDINSIDSAQQNFTADIAIVLRWKDTRLAHTGTGAVHYALDQIWTPRVSIANETSSVVRKLPESAEVEPDGTVLYRQRYIGSFSQPLRLQSFPFDRQIFHFVPDENWIRERQKRVRHLVRRLPFANVADRETWIALLRRGTCSGEGYPARNLSAFRVRPIPNSTGDQTLWISSRLKKGCDSLDDRLRSGRALWVDSLSEARLR